jgi:thymidylate kinase
MRARTILFEGSDGVGKTTLINNFQAYLAFKHISQFVLRGSGNRSTTKINFAIKDDTTKVGPDTEILLRLAREQERMKLLQENREQYEYILIDRGMISLLSWITYYGREHAKYEALTDELLAALSPCDVVFCHLNFEDSWERVTARGGMRPLDRRELGGSEINARIYSVQWSTFSWFSRPGFAAHEIDMAGSPEDCLRELLGSIGPI